MLFWAVFNENQINLEDGSTVFVKGKRYAIQFETLDEYFISLKPNKRNYTKCCSMPISQEGKLFKVVEG